MPVSQVASRLFDGFTKRAVQSQGGLLDGQDPTAFNSADPLRLWIVQVSLIIMMSQLLSLGLRRIRQPRVISEVLGGILLGPTAFGRIPGFTSHIFPTQSIPYLSLVANIGLCLFLFIVGLEIDAGVIKRNARLSVVVSLAGVILPFGIGAAVSIPLYKEFIDPSVKFPYFMLFVAVTYSITAFPVLCRILTELKLLDTTVGLIVLSAGVANDVIAWTLLALSVALVNASSRLTALWTFLVCVAYSLFLFFLVKRVMLWLARKTGSTENGPTVFYMTVVMIVLWASAFFTDVVGVNAIFGAFLAGVIIPREGGLAIALTEKLEDMVTILFLPIYFTLSGLRTDLGLLNDGTAWGFVFVIATLDFTGKVTGTTLASRALGFSWRESGTVGSLMSCKGLVELIVLNVGLSAGILDQRVFSMFVLEALILTFMTTPIVSFLYPPERRTRPEDVLTAHSSTPKGATDGMEDDKASLVTSDETSRYRFTVILDSFDNMPGAMALTQLVLPPINDSTLSNNSCLKKPEVSMNALRLIELSDRTSGVMKSSTADSLIHTDPLLCVFKMFGEQSDIPVSTNLAIVPYDDLAITVAEHAKRHTSDFVLVPWLPPIIGSHTVEDTTARAKADHSPFDTFFGSSSKANKSTGTYRAQFIRNVLAQSKTDAAIFVDIGDRAGASGPQHILFPFFGGPDDRLALEFVVQLCLNSKIGATVIKVSDGPLEGTSVERPAGAVVDERVDTGSHVVPHEYHGPAVISSIGLADTVYGQPNTVLKLQSETADSVLWSRYTAPGKDTLRPQLRSALSRIQFENLSSPVPLHAITQRVQRLREMHRRVLVVTGRSRRLAMQDHHREMKTIVDEHGGTANVASGSFELVRKTIGDVGCALLVSGASSAMVVIQAKAAPAGEA